MIPIKDNLEYDPRIPWVTYGLIALNIAGFVIQMSQQAAGLSATFAAHWIYTSGKFAVAADSASAPWLGQVAASLMISMFMHGNVVHLAGNMATFYVFGPALEAHMGRLRFLAFCLLSGIAAGLYFAGPDAAAGIRYIGASGVGAGIIAAYLVSWPRSRITALAPVLVTTNAFFMLIAFEVMQIMGIWTTSHTGIRESVSTGYWAHAGGLLFGTLVAIAMRLAAWASPLRHKPAVVVPPHDKELYDHVLDCLQSAGNAIVGALRQIVAGIAGLVPRLLGRNDS
jgi:membrane associated rhomboid family serine protease